MYTDPQSTHNKTSQDIINNAFDYAESLMSHCLRCGYKWKQKQATHRPTYCPSCKSKSWDNLIDAPPRPYNPKTASTSSSSSSSVSNQVPFNKLTPNILESILIVFLMEVPSDTSPIAGLPCDIQTARILATQLTNAIVTNLTQQSYPR